MLEMTRRSKVRYFSNGKHSKYLTDRGGATLMPPGGLWSTALKSADLQIGFLHLVLMKPHMAMCEVHRRADQQSLVPANSTIKMHVRAYTVYKLVTWKYLFAMIIMTEQLS